jgi:hypothetical protein
LIRRRVCGPEGGHRHGLTTGAQKLPVLGGGRAGEVVRNHGCPKEHKGHCRPPDKNRKSARQRSGRVHRCSVVRVESAYSVPGDLRSRLTRDISGPTTTMRRRSREVLRGSRPVTRDAIHMRANTKMVPDAKLSSPYPRRPAARRCHLHEGTSFIRKRRSWAVGSCGPDSLRRGWPSLANCCTFPGKNLAQRPPRVNVLLATAKDRRSRAPASGRSRRFRSCAARLLSTRSSIPASSHDPGSVSGGDLRSRRSNRGRSLHPGSAFILEAGFPHDSDPAARTSRTGVSAGYNPLRFWTIPPLARA